MVATAHSKMTTVDSAAGALGISRSHAYRLARTGELPGVRKLGDRYVVSIKELDRFIDGDTAEAQR
ncbi:helix-turn-helix domain-containing protein [Zhihengliuella halotolerans]|uniref:helix-turn-helix domain-containing protein n=1 Tax=Zhihengliuella halotolerans TaxID=370736 RepID=UPI000C80425E|nr:helix-turn-helix domain-containing protein [Zhihengliuella halotolerans]